MIRQTIHSRESAKKVYDVYFNKGYFILCGRFAKEDYYKDSTLCHIHHIVPVCCGGKDEPQNLIKVTKEHHLLLHQKILESVESKNYSLTSSQRRKLFIEKQEVWTKFAEERRNETESVE